MKVIKKDNYKVPVKIWPEFVEESAMVQIDNLASLPFVFGPIAVMPDVHCGYGMPIGTVVGLRNCVSPNMVGVDIGCGMCAVKTTITNMPTEITKEVMGLIRQAIPVGFNHHSQPQIKTKDLQKELCGNGFELDYMIVNQELQSATHQLGTLGGGNHFIEIQTDGESIWIMIHSGSRNLGKKVADYYNKIAIKLNEDFHSEVTKDKQLAFLPLSSVQGHDYLNEMDACLKFAKLNRKHMMDKIMEILADYGGKELDRIDIHHNYAQVEHHFGQNVWVHRKGATSAKEGEMGIIPGSQGTASYVVKGKGNVNSLMSCSHGSGRKMGRNVARKTLSIKSEADMLNAKGIVHSIRNESDLDEAPSAYKDIDTVMKEQEDLVEIVTKLTPLGVIKG